MRVRKRTETLGDYVSRQIREQRLTLRAVERRSRLGGREGISRPSVNKIANGMLANPSPDKLKALARGLGRPEEEIFNVVLGADIVPDDFEKKVLYTVADADSWSPEQKERFLQIAATIASGIRAEFRFMSMEPEPGARIRQGQRVAAKSKEKIPMKKERTPQRKVG